MTIQTETVDYEHQGTALQGFKAWDDSVPGPRPAVLVSHAWAGRGEFENERARDLAELGYTGFALDLYGKGVLGSSVEENQKLMGPFLEDRAMLQDRLKTALDLVRGMPDVDQNHVAAIGFCFGGLCVLDIARTGEDVDGVISFHGLFNAPEVGKADRIKAKVLALHGWDDPMAEPDSVVGFAKEMSEAQADWRLHAYGGTMHAFTNPNANDPDLGTVYNEKSADLAWKAMRDFLSECFV